MTDLKEQYADRISALIPINDISAKLQKRLLSDTEIITCKKRRHVFKQGDRDNFSFYLLDGEIELLADEQVRSTIAAGSDQANYAMAQLQPRQFSAKAKTEVIVLRVDRSVLEQLLMLANQFEPVSESASVEVDIADGTDDDVDWMTKMLQSGIFSKIPATSMHQLFALLQPIEKEAGEVVIRQGDTGEHYYVVESGKGAVYRKSSPTGEAVKLADLGPGDSFGEEALISEAKRSATVKMITDGVVMQLSKDDFTSLIQKTMLESVSFAQAEKLHSEGAVWLDVRFPNEHQASSIKDSINIPLGALRAKIDTLDQNKQYIVYCDTGGRSSSGTYLLTERGFNACFLKGGLVNNPSALPEEAADLPEDTGSIGDDDDDEFKFPDAFDETDDDDFELDSEFQEEMVDIDLETTQIRIVKVKQAVEKADEQTKEKQQQVGEELERKKKKLRAEKKAAEEEMRRKTRERVERLKQLKEKAKRNLQVKKDKLDKIYAKNQAEMEKLERLKRETQEELQEQRESIKRQEQEAKQKLGKADVLKQKLDESRRLLERQARKRKQEQQEMGDKIKAQAKAMLESEKKKLAEEYQRNFSEFKKLQGAKMVAAAAKQAAKKEAKKIIKEFKSPSGRPRSLEEERLYQERVKLEREAKKIQQSLMRIQKTKADAQKAKKQAIERANRLKQQHKEHTLSPIGDLDDLERQLRAAEKKVIQANKYLEDTAQAEKVTASNKNKIDHNLLRKQKEEKALTKQIEKDLINFENEQRRDAESTVVQYRTHLMNRIKTKAEAAKKQVKQDNHSLLADIKKQLD